MSLLIILFGLFPLISYSESLPVEFPPKNFIAISGEIRAVPLTWSMHTNAKILGYVIYRSNSIGSNFKEIAKLPSKYTTSFLDGEEAAPKILNIPSMNKQSLMDNKNYYYKIAAITGENTIGNFSEILKATTAQRPSSPLNFIAYNNGAKVIPLNWLPPNDKTVIGYILYRKSRQDGELLSHKKITGRLTLSYIDKGTPAGKPLEDGHEYYYAISSFNLAKVESYITNIVSAKTKRPPRKIPDIVSSKGNVKSIEIKWTPSQIPDLKHYIISKQRIDSSESDKEIKVPADSTEYIDENLPDGARYHYRVRAVDADGLESLPSFVTSGTTKNIPSTPKNLNISIADEKIVVRWDKNQEPDTVKYEVHKITGFIGMMRKLGVVDTNSFVDRDFKEGDKLSYRIIAVDEDNLKSKKSNVISIRIPKREEIKN